MNYSGVYGIDYAKGATFITDTATRLADGVRYILPVMRTSLR
jgi:hypothetical protein